MGMCSHVPALLSAIMAQFDSSDFKIRSDRRPVAKHELVAYHGWGRDPEHPVLDAAIKFLHAFVHDASPGPGALPASCDKTAATTMMVR